MFVLVAGPPGSGKTSIAQPLAAELNLPLIAKDAIKEALIEVLGWPADVEESRMLGRGAVMAMLTIAKSSPGAVMDSTFFPYTFPHLKALPGPLVEIRCRCSREVAEARYRARSATRHPGTSILSARRKSCGTKNSRSRSVLGRSSSWTRARRSTSQLWLNKR